MGTVIQLMDDFDIYNISAYVTSVTSLILNAILIVCILKKTSSDLISYRNVLLQTCFVDIAFALASGLLVPQAETADYRIFFRTSTLWSSGYGMSPCVGLWIWMWALLVLFWSMMIQALFRYFVVVKRQTPNGAKPWLLQLFLIIAGSIVSLPNLIIPCSNTSPDDNIALITMGLWKWFPQLHYTFRSALYRQVYFASYTIVIFGTCALANTIFFVATWRVKKFLNSSKMHFSKQTLRIHKQFEKKLFLQSIMPVFSLLCLTAIVLYIFVLPPEDANLQGGMLMVAMMPLQYVTVLNPVITLMSIRSYRNACFCRQNSNTPTTTITAVTTIRSSSTLVQLK